MEIFLTILSGVIVFILGQLALKLLIEPIQEFRKTVADIAHALIEYANIYANPGVVGNESEKKASEELRKLSSRLNAQMYLIPFYQIIAKIFGLPPRDKLVGAASDLIGLSNDVFKSSSDLVLPNLKRSERICITLGIYVPENERMNLSKPQPNNTVVRTIESLCVCRSGQSAAAQPHRYVENRAVATFCNILSPWSEPRINRAAAKGCRIIAIAKGIV